MKKKKNKKIGLAEAVIALCKEKNELNSLRVVNAYRSSTKKFLDFHGETDFDLLKITPEIIKRYEHYLKEEGKTRNTISFYMRNLRVIYNRSTKQYKVKYTSQVLFEDVFTGVDHTPKRALNRGDIDKLANFKTNDRKMKLARDLFMLSFYLRGICFVDLAHLRKTDMEGDVLTYCRKKTGQRLVVKVEKPAIEIIKRYSKVNRNSPLLLPLFSGDLNEKAYHSALRSYNNWLKELSWLTGISMKLTSYVARHSWATSAKKAGATIAQISECLGHTSIKTTQIYLDSFDRKSLDLVNKKVLRYIGK